MALRNDIEYDLKNKCLIEKVTLRDLAEKIGTKGQYMSRLMNEVNIVNKTYISALEALGYDIELVYVKREQE